MKNFHKNLNIAFIGGLLGAVLMTYIGPSLIGMLLTPPVSFGINCEPATVYAMKKLILCQVIGLAIGVVITFWLKQKFFSKNQQNNQDAKA